MNIPSEREYDEGVYLLSARAVNHGHQLFTEVFSSQPPAFLESLAFAMRVAGDRLHTGRAFILGFALLALGSIAFIARRLFGVWAAPAAVAALGISATFLDLSHVVQAELPSLAVGLASIGACLKARLRGRTTAGSAPAWNRVWLAVAGALFALAGLLKLFIVPFAAPLLLLLLLAPEHTDFAPWKLDGCGSALLRRFAARLAIVAVAAIAVGCLPLLVYDVGALYEQTISFQLVKHNVYSLNRGANLMRAWHRLSVEPTVAMTAIAGAIWLARRNRLLLAWLSCWLVATLVVLMEQTPLFWRHFVLLSPILSLAAASICSPLTHRKRAGPALAATATLLAVWLYPAIAMPPAVFPLVPRVEYENLQAEPVRKVARWIRRNSDAGDLVAGDDPISIYLADRQSPPGLCDVSNARINAKSLKVRDARKQSRAARIVVLKNDGRLSRLAGYRTWVARNYDKQELPDEVFRTVWVRRQSAAVPKPHVHNF